MEGLCEGGDEPPGTLKAIFKEEVLNVTSIHGSPFLCPLAVRNHALFEIELVVLDNQKYKGFRFGERADVPTIESSLNSVTSQEDFVD
ncbi:hypothetical protein ANN_03361 [Periplaneta americana]|uniref:Uncharacterized protein n=1 Tax=Periplaneta americana TaxID=6978 RepID=A0ABQ8U004_PERAM|nr:hypothetical protein ANN_03361 [Periplaneta americana]